MFISIMTATRFGQQAVHNGQASSYRVRFCIERCKDSREVIRGYKLTLRNA